MRRQELSSNVWLQNFLWLATPGLHELRVDYPATFSVFKMCNTVMRATACTVALAAVVIIGRSYFLLCVNKLL
jgi:hypothetical protein